MVRDAGMGLPVLLRKNHVAAAFRDVATFSTRMFQTGILKGGLASLQGEDHAKMRRIYSLFFLPRSVERYEESVVRPITEEVAGELAGREGVDLVDAFAMELPRRVISRLFGFPMAQIADNDERVRTMFRSIVRVGDPVAAAEGERAYHETLGTITEVVERERRMPSDSLLGEILRTLESERMASLEACQKQFAILSPRSGGLWWAFVRRRVGSGALSGVVERALEVAELAGDRALHGLDAARRRGGEIGDALAHRVRSLGELRHDRRVLDA